jgi:LacI family transcriptional regulator
VLIGSERQYQRGVLRGVARYARLNTQWVIESEPSITFLQHEGLSQLAVAARTDGVMMFVTRQSQLDLLRQSGTPFVSLSSLLEEASLPHVSNDGSAIAAMALEHFLTRGFRNFGFCELDDHSHYRSRYFVAAVREAGFECSLFHVGYRNRRRWVDGRDRGELSAWVASLPKPVAILAHNDVRGRHLADICRRDGVNVPDDVAILGVDNEIPHCELCYPPLSSIATDAERVGLEAAALLDAMMEKRPVAQHRIVVPPTTVVTRHSTDVQATTDAVVNRAVRYIRQHATSGIDVGDVLQELQLSRTALNKRFVRTLGHTPHEEILRVRLRVTQQLLAETDLNIEQIALRTGFQHGEYLGSVFRKRCGQTPGEFRRQNRR